MRHDSFLLFFDRTRNSIEPLRSSPCGWTRPQLPSGRRSRWTCHHPGGSCRTSWTSSGSSIKNWSDANLELSPCKKQLISWSCKWTMISVKMSRGSCRFSLKSSGFWSTYAMSTPPDWPRPWKSRERISPWPASWRVRMRVDQFFQPYPTR